MENMQNTLANFLFFHALSLSLRKTLSRVRSSTRLGCFRNIWTLLERWTGQCHLLGVSAHAVRSSAVFINGYRLEHLWYAISLGAWSRWESSLSQWVSMSFLSVDNRSLDFNILMFESSNSRQRGDMLRSPKRCLTLRPHQTVPAYRTQQMVRVQDVVFSLPSWTDMYFKQEKLATSKLHKHVWTSASKSRLVLWTHFISCYFNPFNQTLPSTKLVDAPTLLQFSIEVRRPHGN